MTEQLIREGLLGVGLPLVVAGAILALAWRVWRARSESRSSPGWAGALSLGAAMIASHVALHGSVNQKWERVVYLLGAAMAIGAATAAVWRLISRARAKSRSGADLTEPDHGSLGGLQWLAWVVADLLTGAAAHLVMTDLFQPGDPAWMRYAVVTGPIAFALLMQPLAERRPGMTLPGAMVMACFAQAGVLVLSGNQTFALIPASLGAASLATVLVSAVVALRGGSVAIGAAAAPLAGVALTIPPVLGLLWVTGLPIAFAWAAGLAALAPVMLWIGEARPIAQRGPTTRLLIRLALVAIPIAAALLLAKANAETDVYFG